MASITFWNRIEPSPRSDKLERHLAAQVRDPLWFLTRQYQFGEYLGEDSASPAYVELNGRFSPITGWFAPEGPVTPFQNGAPLEELIQSEGFTPNWAMAVELGQRYEDLLIDAGMPTTFVAAFRGVFAVPGPDSVANSDRDHDLRRFLLVCGGRGIDGIGLLNAIQDAPDGLPPDPPPPGGVNPDDIRALNQEFVSWVTETFGEISSEDAPSWQADRLEYRAHTTAITAEGDPVTLDAYPNHNGAFDWYAFDQQPEFTLDDTDSPADGTVSEFSRSVLPTGVVFPGMPNKRWWHFEDSRRDFGELRASRLELGKIIVLDFMLVHGNDWYVIPFAQDVGSLCRIDSLLVHDVFGETTLVNRADEDPQLPWSLFATAIGDGPERADYFVLSPSAIGASLQSAPIEEVRFIRDEMANLAWGIERSTENGVGLRWPGHERADQLGSEPLEYNPTTADAPPLKYLLQTRVPEHWIPLVPVRREPGMRAIAFQRAAALRPGEGGQPAQPIPPLGRILNPTDPESNPKYWIEEEEIPREGAEVRRRIERSRWLDGSTHFWIARESGPGAGEGRSGLRFDQALAGRKRERGND